MKVLGQNYFSMNSVLETVSKSISSLKSNCTCKILFKIIPFSDQVNRRKKLATSRGLKRYTHEQYGLEIIWMQQKKCITQFIIYYPSQPSEPRFFTLTKRDMAKFCHRHMGEIYVMDQHNSVFFTGYFGISHTKRV